MSKQYGLILPNSDKGHKIAAVTATRPAIFNEDSDSDSPETKPTGVTKSIKKQDKLNQHKAIKEDPTVYQYDEIYDEMDQQRKESKLSRKDLDRKPKYISKLLAAADKRKRENERRIERQVQKEREEEGEQFQDKESFVTSAYKKKLEELRELEEQEKREEYLESIGDVRKQGNLDGFYRHLYDQKVNYEEKKEIDPEKENADIKEAPKSDSDDNRSAKKRKSSESQSDLESKIKPKKDVKKRKYRTRKESEDQSDEENKTKKEHLPSNLDADSDFSIDSSDSEDEKVEKGKEEKLDKTEADDEKKDTNNLNVEENKENEAKELVENQEEEKLEEKIVEVKPKKNKVDIWKKRTVGEKFDEALKRYFERKSLREAGM
ncbi:hypothetical protein NQ314_000674 [Rhamnusium bicolor]|uniref:Nuclear speckle splicing regulatory protein 1 N-terminal domain-containing protein n=1 Tax=Rhamnusium bicolor TaxID=1586634 RepID=A0AAV8ZV69_9CUCU|nr:hypothetical protein NQ314_000674 [Rhamnusium bicolor]